MNFSIDNGLSRYTITYVVFLSFFCGRVQAGIDDVWAASPATQDTAWAQQYAAPVNPAISGGGGVKYQISTYRGDWGNSADFGWHHWCALTAHTANGDRGTGWNVFSAGFDAATTKSHWKVTYYNLSSWGATCYDVM